MAKATLLTTNLNTTNELLKKLKLTPYYYKILSMTNNFNYQKFAKDFYNKSSEEASNHPLDMVFMSENFINISKEDFINILIYNINNFPNIYVARFLLLSISNYLIYFDTIDWINLHKSMSKKYSINTLMSFYISYLKLKPSMEILELAKLDYDYIYENDEEDFIENNSLEMSINELRTNMLSIGFVPLST